MLRRFLARQFARPSGPVGRFVVGPWLDRIARDMNRLAFEQLHVERKDWVLEVGFGGGDLLRRILLATSGEVFGVDLSEAMVKRAQGRFRRDVRRGRLRLRVSPVDALPIPDATLDKACSVNSLYFWPDPAAALAELARVVKPGGWLSLCFEPAEELRRWAGHRYGFRLYEEPEVRALMEAAGFGLVRSVWGSGHKPDRFCCLSGERMRGHG